MRISLLILWPIFGAILAENGFATNHQEFRHYDGFKLFQAIPATNAQIAALQNLSKSVGIRSEENEGIEFWKFSRHLGMPAEIFASKGEEEKLRRFLRQNHIFHQKVIDDFGIQMREAGETMRHDEPMEFIDDLREFDLGKYHRFEAILQYLQILAKTHPAFVNLASLGKTFEGREMAMIKLGYPTGAPKPMLLLDAGIHAREWIAPAVALHVINALVNDPKWHSLLREIDVHIIPVVNPDGYAHSWDKDRLWRRTRSGPYSTSGVCRLQMGSEWNRAVAFDEPSMCFGADPNRNFPYHWAESGTDSCPCSEVYPGPGALSEVECAHLAEYMRANRQQIKAYLTLHAYGNLLIHAWNYAQHTYPQDVADIKLVANQMANAILRAGGPRFTVGSAPDILYEAAGGSDDYASSLGIKYSYTLELTNGQFGQLFGGFVYPEKGINQEASKILPGILVLANKVKENGNN